MIKNFSYKKIGKVLGLAVILGLIAIAYIHTKYPNVVVDQLTFADHATPAKSTQNKAAPTTFLLPVPFTSQAPTANWDALHNEACEEADAIMAAQYFQGNREVSLKADLVEEQIRVLTAWQDEHFGYHLDTTSAQTARMIEDVYGLKTRLIPNFTAEQLQSELAQKHIVLISAAGRELHNPNYKSPGPLHHMLLVRGYTATNFVTNDSGTRNGLNYAYSFSTIYSAAADWNQATQNIDPTQKIAIIVFQ